MRPWEQPEKEWPVYGVNNRNGVFFSHFQPGDKFNAAYKRIARDWFFHNPTRANVGSLGRVPDVPPDAITSPEYQVWRIRRALTPDFVEILIGLPMFRRLIEIHRVGAVKERLFVQNLCEIPVPCPSLATQRDIVQRWRTAQSQVTEALSSAEKILGSAERDFLRQLGFDLAAPAAQRTKVFVAHWEQIDRWSVSAIQEALNAVDLRTGRYPVVDLGSLLTLVQYGTSAKANTQARGLPVLRMNNIRDGELDLTDLKHLDLPERERVKLLLKPDDILINRTNSKELVGKCAVFRRPEEAVFASYLIRLRVARQSSEADYVAALINSRLGRQQIDRLSRQIIGQANINSEELRSLRIPLPPLNIQRKLASKLMQARTHASEQRQRGAEIRMRAADEIEQRILGPS